MPSGDRSRVSRPVRRLKRWARYTPNERIALNLVAIGLALLFFAGGLAIFVL